MMNFPEIRPAAQEESEACVAVITLGFANDPGVRWMYPDPKQYRESFPHFVRAFGGRAFEHGSADCIGGHAAVALWLPPGIHPDEEALLSLIEASVPACDRATVFALFEEMAGYHPSEPHWHLPLIATEPRWQGQGLGNALLRHRLAVCDQQGLTAYLEATSERSVPLYQGLGFEALGTIQVGASPPIVPMLRRPQCTAPAQSQQPEGVPAG